MTGLGLSTHDESKTVYGGGVATATHQLNEVLAYRQAKARAFVLEVREGREGREALVHGSIDPAVLPAQAQEGDGEGRGRPSARHDPDLGGDCAERAGRQHRVGSGLLVEVGNDGAASEELAVPERPAHGTGWDSHR